MSRLKRSEVQLSGTDAWMLGIIIIIIIIIVHNFDARYEVAVAEVCKSL